MKRGFLEGVIAKHSLFLNILDFELLLAITHSGSAIEYASRIAGLSTGLLYFKAISRALHLIFESVLWVFYHLFLLFLVIFQVYQT